MFKFPIFIAVIFFGVALAAAQTTEFTYQGRLMDGSLPANASYDLEFKLFDVDTGGAELGTQTRNGVAVANGIFTVRLDFGVQFTGSARWLEIAVKPAGGPTFTPLNPRQPVTSAPYSIKSRNADTASNSTMLGSIAANQYVITTDTRMTDARNPLPNSGNYVQNSVAQQTASNFNISGDGRVGGTVTANAVTSETQYNIGGNRILFAPPGTGNFFVGQNTGTSITTGTSNSFFGIQAGNSTTSGSTNSFFGERTGVNNTTGFSNSFFGAQAGISNTNGNTNSFFGSSAGRSNLSGSDNTFVGVRLDFRICMATKTHSLAGGRGFQIPVHMAIRSLGLKRDGTAPTAAIPFSEDGPVRKQQERRTLFLDLCPVIIIRPATETPFSEHWRAEQILRVVITPFLEMMLAG